MDTLAVLARLARQALDRERLRLRAIDDERGGLEARIAELQAAATSERRVAAELAGGQAALAAYLEVNQARQRAARDRLTEVETARAEQMTRLLARRLELERLEILAERCRQRLRDDSRRRAQQEIDELVLTRAARARMGH